MAIHANCGFRCLFRVMDSGAVACTTTSAAFVRLRRDCRGAAADAVAATAAAAGGAVGAGRTLLLLRKATLLTTGAGASAAAASSPFTGEPGVDALSSGLRLVLLPAAMAEAATPGHASVASAPALGGTCTCAALEVTPPGSSRAARDR